jgi:hypothetical protein
MAKFQCLSKKSSGSLPSSSVAMLRAWYLSNHRYPYPSRREKQKLAMDSNLTLKQVTNWLSNARKRKKFSVEDPQSSSGQLTPMEAWLSSGSDEEPASESDIRSEAENLTSSLRIDKISSTFLHSRKYASSEGSAGSAFSQCDDAVISGPPRQGRKTKLLRQDTTVYPVERYPFLSDISHFQPATDLKAEQKENTDKSGSSTKNMQFQCTFCREKLSSKTWRRHEESQHLPQFQWICMRDSPTLRRPGSDVMVCAFCFKANPDSEHFESAHKMSRCKQRPEDKRAFSRQDHLAQHIRQMHDSELHTLTAKAWKHPVSYKDHNWECGFCDETLCNWDTRARHISAHFREGLTMSSWGFGSVAGASTGNPFDTAPLTDSVLITPLEQERWQKQKQEQKELVYGCNEKHCSRRFQTDALLQKHREMRHGRRLVFDHPDGTRSQDHEIFKALHENNKSRKQKFRWIQFQGLHYPAMMPYPMFTAPPIWPQTFEEDSNSGSPLYASCNQEPLGSSQLLSLHDTEHSQQLCGGMGDSAESLGLHGYLDGSLQPDSSEPAAESPQFASFPAAWVDIPWHNGS